MRDLARRETSSGDHLLQCEPRLSCISRGIQKNARLGSSGKFELRNCLDRKSDHFLTQFEFELPTTEIDDDMSSAQFKLELVHVGRLRIPAEMQALFIT